MNELVVDYMAKGTNIFRICKVCKQMSQLIPLYSFTFKRKDTALTSSLETINRQKQ